MFRLLISARVFNAFAFACCLFFVAGAWGQGACPAGLPVTGAKCYFIAASGSDSNSGTSESSPWLHAPGMPNCTGNCGAVKPSAGTGFIFRGGDTWHFGNSAASPYTGGAFDGYNVNGWKGTSASPIYIGVDTTWYSGASWARPVFTGDNPASPGINSYVASCPYQTAGDGNTMVDFSGGDGYIIFDNFELTGMCQTTTNDQSYVGENQPIAGLQFWNLYIHGWSHLAFHDSSDPVSCGSPGLCFAMWGFRGGVGGSPEPIYKNIVIDGSDSDARSLGACYCNLYDMENSVIRYTSQTIVTSPHIFANNLVEYFWDNGHGNVLESMGDFAGTDAIYGNVIRHVNTTPVGANPVGVWMLPSSGNTSYFFNNVFYDWNGAQYLNIGNSGTSVGNYVVFNNTFQTNVNQTIMNCQYMQGGVLQDTNNLFVDDGTQYTSPCNNKTSTTPLLLSNGTATSDGYTSSENYAYAPTSRSSPTVGAGTNGASLCSALSSAGLIAAATACQSDSTYSCVYNTANHTVSCPARTVVSRPSSGVWDVSAYQDSGSTPGTPVGLTGTLR